MIFLIQVQNLSKTYKLDGLVVPALKDINLKIPESEMVSITGPSGCGKSTLMHLLGLLDKPSSGEIIFKGIDVSRFSEIEQSNFRSREVGFVFQQFNLLQRVTALENVLLPTIYLRNVKGVPLASRDFLKKRAIDLLGRMGLSHRLDHRPNQLSGGEQQRVAIARSLINDPSLILADEPTGNLDSRSGLEILNLLKELNATGKTVVVVTHDANVASSCQRIIKLKDGEVVS